MVSGSQNRLRILIAFALVYVFWGSTYLGIGIAVEHIPPALMCAVRFLISGPTGWQGTFAGVANLIIALGLGQHHQVVWTARGLAAVGYLIVFGSWIGYTSYIYLLEHVPTSKVSTYAYVNPVVAVFLGWLILHERVDHFIFWGSAITLAAVVLVTSAKVEKTSAGHAALPALETVGD